MIRLWDLRGSTPLEVARLPWTDAWAPQAAFLQDSNTIAALTLKGLRLWKAGPMLSASKSPLRSGEARARTKETKASN